MSGVFQNIDTLAWLGGGGGSIFWKTPDTALYSTYVSTLWPTPSNGPSNVFACIKIVKSKRHKKTGTLVILSTRVSGPTTYAPMIYTSLCIIFCMRAYPLLGEVGGGWALEFPSFLGPKWKSPIGSFPFHRDQNSGIPGHNPLPLSPRNGYARTQNIMHGPNL